MKKVLFIDACITNNEMSRTRMLCEAYLEKYYSAGNTDVAVETLVLENQIMQPLMTEKLAERSKMIEAGRLDHPMFGLAREFAEADVIVIGAPYWDLSFPSILKIYIGNIMVNTLTFRYGDHGQEGLCKAEKLVYITTAGGYIGDRNHGYNYVKDIANTLGIMDTQFISAEGLDIAENDAMAILQEKIQTL
ncbi:MAG: NAD(P)H-dependent oxidoreductase [bacterium]|nr:NAD(P)H-dependent oxidoreductase [bacterium]